MSWLDPFTGALKGIQKGLSAPHEDPAKISTARGDVQQGQVDQTRSEQEGLGSFWQNQMAGKGPSVAELQLRQGAQMAGQQARATAASARGANMALAGRGAAIGASNAVMNVNNQAAQLRAGEQLAGAQQYQQLLQAQRQQDLMARGLSEQEAIAQLQAETAVKTGNLSAAAQAKGAGFGLVGAGAGILSGSDERTKQNVEPVSGDDPDASVPELIKGASKDDSSSGGDLGGLLNMIQMSDTLTKDNVLPYGNYEVPPPTASFPVGPGGTVPRVETAYDAAPPPTARYADAPSAAPRFAPARMQFRPQDTQPAPAFGPDTNPLAPELRTADYMSKGAGPEVQREQQERDKKEFDKLTKKPGEDEKDKGPNGWQIGGGLGMIGMGLMAMSDKDTKQHIDDLKTENLTLRKTMAQTGHAILQHLPIPGQQPFVPRNEAEAAEYGADWTRRNQQAMDRDVGDVLAYKERDAKAQARLRQAEAIRRSSQGIDEQLVSDSMAKNDVFGLGKLAPAEYPHPRSPYSTGRLPDVHPSVGRMPDVHPLSDAFAKVPAKEWEYKPEFAAEANQSRGLPPDDEFGRRRQVGPMAQDFERIPELAPAVKEGPDGVKRVDTGRVAMTSASAIGELSRRLDELEGLKLREMKAAGKGRR